MSKKPTCILNLINLVLTILQHIFYKIDYNLDEKIDYEDIRELESKYSKATIRGLKQLINNNSGKINL